MRSLQVGTAAAGTTAAGTTAAGTATATTTAGNAPLIGIDMCTGALPPVGGVMMTPVMTHSLSEGPSAAALAIEYQDRQAPPKGAFGCSRCASMKRSQMWRGISDM